MSNRSDPGTRYQTVDLSGGDVTFSPPCRCLMIGTGGVITGVPIGLDPSATPITTNVLPIGMFPVGFHKISQSGTNAALITAVW